MILTGQEAFDYAKAHGLLLNKYAEVGSHEDHKYRDDLTLEEGQRVLDRDPELLWVRKLVSVLTLSEIWSSALLKMKYPGKWLDVYGEQMNYMGRREPNERFKKFLMGISRAEYLLDRHTGGDNDLWFDPTKASLYGWCHSDWTRRPNGPTGGDLSAIFFEFLSRVDLCGLVMKSFTFNYHLEFPCGVLIRTGLGDTDRGHYVANEFASRYGCISYGSRPLGHEETRPDILVYTDYNGSDEGI